MLLSERRPKFNWILCHKIAKIMRFFNYFTRSFWCTYYSCYFATTQISNRITIITKTTEGKTSRVQCLKQQKTQQTCIAKYNALNFIYWWIFIFFEGFFTLTCSETQREWILKSQLYKTDGWIKIHYNNHIHK